ncbi:hypothetical protein FRC17_000526 [Serendipita sp. 399]|nr:hypothetical protein FRC17_000526 [Serendipita sp. 399]
MLFDEMKQSLSLLNAQLKAIEAIEDPTLHSFLLSSPSTTGTSGDLFLIEKFEQTIRDLSRDLNDGIRQYLSLATSLIRRGRAVAKRPAIDRLPNEVVIEIFRRLVEDGSHQLKPLFLVNKRFYAMVTSVPSLWCNINIRINSMLQETNDLSRRYIQACVERSQQSLLHVSLDVTDVSPTWGYAASILAAIRNVVPQFSDLIDHTEEAVWETEWYDEGAFYDLRMDEICDLVEAMIGPEGSYMRRWKSFIFFPPTEYDLVYLGQLIWDLFTHPTPDLETFILNGPISFEGTFFNSSFTDLTAVRHLTLLQPNGYKWAPLSRHLLVTAVLQYDPDNTLEILSDCIALQELTITQIRRPPADLSREAREIHVNLPSLQRLTLDGDVSELKNVIFLTPCLKGLMLLCWCEDGIPDGIPKVRARSIVWTPKREKNPDHMGKFLQLLLMGVEEMEELVLDCERVEGLSLVIPGTTTQNAAIMGTLPVVRFKECDA